MKNLQFLLTHSSAAPTIGNKESVSKHKQILLLKTRSVWVCLCVYECVCSVMSNSLLLNLCLLHLLHLQANSLPPASPGKPLPTYTNHFLAINVKLLHFYELSMIQTIFLLICILVLLLIFLKNGSLLFFFKEVPRLWSNMSYDTGVYACSRVQLLAMPWTVAHQALLSMGFPREEHWSG